MRCLHAHGHQIARVRAVSPCASRFEFGSSSTTRNGSRQIEAWGSHEIIPDPALNPNSVKIADFFDKGLLVSVFLQGRSRLRIVLQKIPNLTVLAAQPLFKILSTLFTVTVRTSDGNDGSYGFFLGLEESARWSSKESHFCDCVTQKLLNPGDFSSHRPPSISFLTRNISRSQKTGTRPCA
jgi:hypothetical protein